MPIVVYKLGGSLLDLPDWPARLRTLWQTRPSGETGLLIVGGGPAADLVRQWDRLYDLGEAASHHLALTSLGLTEHLASLLLPECHIIANADQANAVTPGTYGIVTVREFLRNRPDDARPIPERWDFTTDSIAACIAGEVQAKELILLKSATPTVAADLNNLTEHGFVDREFRNWARQIPRIEIINLRQVDHKDHQTSFERVRVESR